MGVASRPIGATLPPVRRMAVCLVLALLGAIAPATAQADVHADRDRDKLFDDLEPQLTGSGRLPILVSLNDEASTARLDRITEAVGDLGNVTRLRVVDAFAAKATPAQIRALARRSDVAHVEEDSKVVEFGVSAQNAFGVTRAREDIPGLDGEGLVAAVVDSGIDTTIPDLPPSKVIGWKDLVLGRETPYDDTVHGTLVSSVLAGSGAGGAEGRGVAPAAKLVGVKVINQVGQSSLSLIAQGIQWVVENRATYGIDAMNLSIGDPVGCGSGTDVASQAVDAAVAAGIVVVAAAGNAGPANCTVKSPGAVESALTVGAMADTGAGGFSQGFFSSRGPTADGRIKPDISAAGVNVPMAMPGGGYVANSGTSVAAPFTTGTALLMLQANPTLSPAQIKQTIMNTAIDWGRPGKDVDYGAGRLDVYAALRAVGAPLAVPPAVPDHRVWSGTLAEGGVATSDVDIADPRFPLALTMHGPGAGFDLSLRDAGGTNVGTMTTQWGPSRQEDITLNAPAPGHYTVRVEARSGAGDFVVDVSAALAPADAAAPGLTLADLPAATNDDTPSLRGTAGTGLGDFPSVVARVLRDGQVVRRLAAAPLLGQWSIDVTPALAPGAYTVEAEQGDSAGNVTRRSAPFGVDTAAPAAPVINPVTSPQSSRTVALAGTAEANAELTIAEGSSQLADVTAGAGGAWAHALQDVGDGTHTYTVVATDAAGNASTPASLTVRVDATAPQTAIVAAPPSVTSNREPAVSFSADEASTFECRLDGPGGTSGTYAACASPVKLAELADGAYQFLVRATDTAGNTDGSPASADFTVDTVLPDTAILSGPDGAVSDTTPTFAFSSEAGATFECAIDGVAHAACANPFTAPELAQGAHTLSVRAVDAAGNRDNVPATRSFSVDTVAPETTINSGPNPATNNTAPQFTFSANESASFECRLDTPSGAGTFQSCTTPRTLSTAAQGSYTFLVRATDAATNTDQTPASRTFTIDTTAPDTTIETGPTGSVPSTTATFTFGSTESGSSFQCSLDGAGFGACLASYTSLAQGSHTLQVRATDAAGNTDATPASRTWMVDTQAPAAPAITAPANGAVLATQTFTLSGTSEANATVEVFEGSASRGTATANAGGTWSRELSSVPEGSHTYTATARDAAGNVSDPSSGRTVTVDVSGPEVSIDGGPIGLTKFAGQIPFHSTDANATFECRLDGPGRTDTFQLCTSPAGYGGLQDGAHTFRVRAKDAAGNLGAEATRQFTLDTRKPDSAGRDRAREWRALRDRHGALPGPR